MEEVRIWIEVLREARSYGAFRLEGRKEFEPLSRVESRFQDEEDFCGLWKQHRENRAFIAWLADRDRYR